MIKEIVVVEDNESEASRLEQVLMEKYQPNSLEVFVSCQQALSASLPTSLDLAVVDLDLPDGRGESLIEHFCSPDTKVLVNSKVADSERVLDAIKKGAHGYLNKGDSTLEICNAIDLIFAGGAPISPNIATLIISSLQTPKKHIPDIQTLTPRELEILKLINKGYTSKEVADILSLKYNTVASYVKSVYRKLNVNSRCEAIFEARQQGVLDDEH